MSFSSGFKKMLDEEFSDAKIRRAKFSLASLIKIGMQNCLASNLEEHLGQLTVR